MWRAVWEVCVAAGMRERGQAFFLARARAPTTELNIERRRIGRPFA